MSKTKHKYNVEEEYGLDGEDSSRKEQDRHKQKRIERALKTKNIDELVNLEDEGISPEEFFYWDEHPID